MKIDEQAERIERLIRLLNFSDTGTADELARKLCVSRHTILKDLEYMKGKGYQIVFSRMHKSYQFVKKRNDFSFYKEIQWE